MPLTLRNPHSILAALKTRAEDVTEILAPQGKNSNGEAWDEVVKLAQNRRVPVRAPTTKNQSRGPTPQDGGRAPGLEATVKERLSTPVEKLFERAPERAGGKGLWIALDNLQDPQNVGAIFRVAAFFGVQGIMLTQERSAPLSSTVYDVASGGMESVPFTLQTNLQRGFEVAKEAGLWILGSSEHAQDDLRTVARDRPWLLVLGNEEKGMRRLTEEACDVRCKISTRGGENVPAKVTSLNVSVAAGILISHLA